MPPFSRQLGRRQALERMLGATVVMSTAGLVRTPARAATDTRELVSLLKLIDERQTNLGDYRADIYLENKEKDKVTIAYNAMVFRRSRDDKFLFLFTKPKTSQGQGYLQVEKNMWFYDPGVGRWERRTARDRIGDTNSRSSDFEDSHLAEDYEPTFEADERLGAYDTLRLYLRGKPGLDLAFPMLRLWVDKASRNMLKRHEFALSGRLIRTSYYPKWKKVFSESKQAEVWYPEEIRMFDEVVKESSTLARILGVDLRPLEKNLFTKAWVESKSR
jgi:hypothetical protein